LTNRGRLIEGLDRYDRQAIGADLKTAQFGWPMGMPFICKFDLHG
jgi:hypothetical protein